MEDQDQIISIISIAETAQVSGGMINLERPVTQSQPEGTYWFHGTMTSSTNGVGTVYYFD